MKNGRWSPPRDGPLSVRKIFLLNVERRFKKGVHLWRTQNPE
uniref:Uncharacterized protein n=1 Tax=Myoviridae sp. ctaNG1 TaxID=2825132 RepID=A0A8S5P895_9CAUD|nr:MAG TPA: hypothetical protein [Myoviridae sp. ctaNG1]